MIQQILPRLVSRKVLLLAFLVCVPLRPSAAQTAFALPNPFSFHEIRKFLFYIQKDLRLSSS